MTTCVWRSARTTAAASASLILAACVSGPEPGERTVFHNPYGAIGLAFPTPATTEHPPYVVCNGDRCGYRDKNGNWTQMSDDERRAYRMGIRLAEQNRRFNEGQRFPPPDPPENRTTDMPVQRAPEAGDTIPD